MKEDRIHYFGKGERLQGEPMTGAYVLLSHSMTAVKRVQCDDGGTTNIKLVHIRRKGRTLSTAATVSLSPICTRSCGAKKITKTRQSKYDIGPRIIIQTRDIQDPNLFGLDTESILHII